MDSSTDISIYETKTHWVKKTEEGTFEVYRIGITHSVRCAVIGWTGEDGFRRAKAECDRRSKSHD